MQVVPLFSAAEVELRVAEIADRLYRDYADSPLTILCIAEEARRFAQALSERLKRGSVRHELHFVVARRTGETDPGAVQVDGFDPTQFEERDVLVVDDVADEGTKLGAVLELMAWLRPGRFGRRSWWKRGDRGAMGRGRITWDSKSSGGPVVGYGMAVEGEFGELDEIGVVSGSES